MQPPQMVAGFDARHGAVPPVWRSSPQLIRRAQVEAPAIGLVQHRNSGCARAERSQKEEVRRMAPQELERFSGLAGEADDERNHAGNTVLTAIVDRASVRFDSAGLVHV